MRSFFLLAIFLAAVSSASAGGALRRLRRTADAVQDAVHEKYMDLASLVTNGRTLRRVKERQNLRQRKMIGFKKFNVMSDRSTLVDLYGLGIESVPAATEQPEEAAAVTSEMSMADVKSEMSMADVKDVPLSMSMSLSP